MYPHEARSPGGETNSLQIATSERLNAERERAFCKREVTGSIPVGFMTRSQRELLDENLEHL